MMSLLSTICPWLRASDKPRRPTSRRGTVLQLESLEGRYAPSSNPATGDLRDFVQQFQQMRVEFQHEIQVEFQQLNAAVQATVQAVRQFEVQLEHQIEIQFEQLEQPQEAFLEILREMQHQQAGHGGADDMQPHH